MNGGDGDTSVTQRGQRLISDAQEELFSNNVKTGSSRRQQSMDSSGMGKNFSGELHAREIQSVAARAVYQMVPLSASTVIPMPPTCPFGQKPGFD